MIRPQIASITINWIDEEGNEHNRYSNESTLEDAETLLSLMTGNLTEDDLNP